MASMLPAVAAFCTSGSDASRVALYQVLVVTFSWRGVALINGLGIAAATGIGVGVAAATGAALGLATAMDAVGFDVIAGVETGVIAGVETGVTASAEGVGVTSGSSPGPPKRVTLTSARAIISAPPTTAPTTRFRFGDRAGRGAEATADMLA